MVLYQNEITKVGASTFIYNARLTYLDLGGNPLNSLNAKELENFYKKDNQKTYVGTQKDIKILPERKNLI